MPPSYPPLPTPSHSNELEHRLTVVETIQVERARTNEERQKDTESRLDAHDRRLNLHEKAILAICGVLQILMQDKYPAMAELIKGLLR